MPGAARQTDIHHNPADFCGCLQCNHDVYGYLDWVSDDTFIETLGAARGNQIDGGRHNYCCGPQVWRTLMCSDDTFINGIGAVRLGDETICCGGKGKIISASSKVFIN